MAYWTSGQLANAVPMHPGNRDANARKAVGSHVVSQRESVGMFAMVRK